MSKIGSWVNNMTTWFQFKRDQSRLPTSEKTNQNIATPAKPQDVLSQRVLDIMHKPDPKDYGPKRPNKP